MKIKKANKNLITLISSHSFNTHSELMIREQNYNEKEKLKTCYYTVVLIVFKIIHNQRMYFNSYLPFLHAFRFSRAIYDNVIAVKCTSQIPNRHITSTETKFENA